MTNEYSSSIRYIGVDDLDIDLFESQYVVPDGVSYNSYLILDEKVAVMDTVDLRKADEWLDNLNTALAGRKPDYLIVQHLEPDHAGTIARVMSLYPEMQVVASDKAVKMLPNFFYDTTFEGRTIGVKEGDTLSLGGRTLTFAMAPMVHWPEVIVTYDSTDKVLFSADGFGKFGALDADEDWVYEADGFEGKPFHIPQFNVKAEGIDELNKKLYAIPKEINGGDLDEKALKALQGTFFKNIYKLLIDKEKGPRLYLFLFAIDPKRYVGLLDFSYPKTEEEKDLCK